jgi:hypothetical protein
MDQGAAATAEGLILANTERCGCKQGRDAPIGISQMKYGTEIVVVGLAAFLAMLGSKSLCFVLRSAAAHSSRRLSTILSGPALPREW